jgi:hypothetical protein
LNPILFTNSVSFVPFDDLLIQNIPIYFILFPGETQSNSLPDLAHAEASDNDSDGDEPDEAAESLSYQEKLAKQFEADLNQVAKLSSVTSELQHIDEEISLAAKTGELTSKLGKLLTALASIPAASIESERAFSVASRYMTKIRSRLGDGTLDNFSFAKCKFKNDKSQLVNFQILSFILTNFGGLLGIKPAV